eukprot:5033024-Pleurochrysis_carterae.AAC.1
MAVAVLTLFEMAFLELWPDVMYRGMDTYNKVNASSWRRGFVTEYNHLIRACVSVMRRSRDAC